MRGRSHDCGSPACSLRFLRGAAWGTDGHWWRRPADADTRAALWNSYPGGHWNKPRRGDHDIGRKLLGSSTTPHNRYPTGDDSGASNIIGCGGDGLPGRVLQSKCTGRAVRGILAVQLYYDSEPRREGEVRGRDSTRERRNSSL